MIVTITCKEYESFKSTIKVYDLLFNKENNTFFMPLCMGDDWMQKVNCPHSLCPTKVSSLSRAMDVEFELYRDVADFGAWLIEANIKVKHGFRTMRG
ncbi:hypothetical protein S225a_25330 [Candidatus Brocadiaceae bacterium S225]|uniref:Uncharacterized protein n=1 Tax=Candidatus Scalindua brodae TaxID=237368 RepID=A0A0B0ER55_9BACT|nr:MAG: hypothetical protein SCABRO_00673 [Candidatus Scalindua brodae]TWU29159.1 hypothetical protein S225a_25330 [Candidatus Brocadiaceae bacterium S225]